MAKLRRPLTITTEKKSKSGALTGKVDPKARDIDKAPTQPTKKTCTKCGKEKNETDFPLTKVRGRMLRRSWCDACMKLYYKAYQRSRARP